MGTKNGLFQLNCCLLFVNLITFNVDYVCTILYFICKLDRFICVRFKLSLPLTNLKSPLLIHKFLSHQFPIIKKHFAL